MNSSVLYGGLAFVGWSIFSSWYYVCQIQGYCQEDPIDPIAVVIPESEVIEEIAETETVILQPIVLKLDGIPFSFNSDQPSNLEELTGFLTNAREQISDRKVSVVLVGHTCDLGSMSYNDKLGLKRANVVAEILMSAGYNQKDMTLRSDGENNPLVKNTSDENRARNRRVELTIKTTDQ